MQISSFPGASLGVQETSYQSIMTKIVFYNLSCQNSYEIVAPCDLSHTFFIPDKPRKLRKGFHSFRKY